MKDLNRQRTDFAYQYLVNPCNKIDDMAPLIQSIPLLIRRNGLGNTMLFLKRAKNENAKSLYKQFFETWLRGTKILPEITDLIEHIQTADQFWYMEAKNEAYQLANILRFVHSQLYDKE